MTLNEALSNEELAIKFEEANSMNDILETLKQYGVETTEEELINTIKAENSELSEDQLENVTGGLIINPLARPLITSGIVKLGVKTIISLIRAGKLKSIYLTKPLQKMLIL